jgi:hypothetical protein
MKTGKLYEHRECSSYESISTKQETKWSTRKLVGDVLAEAPCMMDSGLIGLKAKIACVPPLATAFASTFF